MNRHVNGRKPIPTNWLNYWHVKPSFRLKLQLQLSRTNLDQNIPTTKHTGALQKAGRILTEEELVRKGTNVNQVVTQLFDARYAKRL